VLFFALQVVQQAETAAAATKWAAEVLRFSGGSTEPDVWPPPGAAEWQGKGSKPAPLYARMDKALGSFRRKTTDTAIQARLGVLAKYNLLPSRVCWVVCLHCVPSTPMRHGLDGRMEKLRASRVCRRSRLVAVRVVVLSALVQRFTIKCFPCVVFGFMFRPHV
jgi:hypothetical protein